MVHECDFISVQRAVRILRNHLDELFDDPELVAQPHTCSKVLERQSTAYLVEVLNLPRLHECDRHVIETALELHKL